MKEAGNKERGHTSFGGMSPIEMIEQCLNLSLMGNRYRQAVINKVAVALLSEGHTETEALSIFFWKLADLEPPITHGFTLNTLSII